MNFEEYKRARHTFVSWSDAAEYTAIVQHRTSVASHAVMRIVPQELVNSERGGVHPAVEPDDAATLIVVDRSRGIPKVLLGRRHSRHVFMPGKFVFPGGRVDAADRVLAPQVRLHPAVQRKLLARTALTAADATALALAAIRETFEETGLIAGLRERARFNPSKGAWATFEQAGFKPAPSALHFIARAITPPGFQRRFDARFFSVDRTEVVHQLENVVHPDAELVEVRWLSIQEALTLDLPLITGLVLAELQERIDAGFDHDLPVPFYQNRAGEFTRDMIE